MLIRYAPVVVKPIMPALYRYIPVPVSAMNDHDGKLALPSPVHVRPFDVRNDSTPPAAMLTVFVPPLYMPESLSASNVNVGVETLPSGPMTGRRLTTSVALMLRRSPPAVENPSWLAPLLNIPLPRSVRNPYVGCVASPG